jgi:proline iminopeptidase
MNRRQFLQASAVLTASVSLPIRSDEAQTPISTDNTNPQLIRTAGIRMIPVVNGKYKVWTKRIGSGKTKVLLLHGGPAAASPYLEVMESFLPEAGVEFFLYDQLGCGNSDIPEDTSLWTLPRYLSEVEEVRQGLGLDHFVLYGHSWGGILALEYALHYQQHLKGLVISNMTAGTQAYLRRTSKLKSTMLNPAQRLQLEALERGKDYDNPAYEQLMMEVLYPQMICRVQPWPEPLTRSFRELNTKIYEQMQGKSEFEVTGNLKDWERWDRLHEIKVRTLTIGSRYDEMDPEDMKKMASMMQNATSHICPNGSHMCMYDDQETYFRGLVPFLQSL